VPERLCRLHVPECLCRLHVPERLCRLHVPERLCRFHLPERLCRFLVPEHLCRFHVPERLCSFLVSERLCSFLVSERLCRLHVPERLCRFLVSEHLFRFHVGRGPERLFLFVTPAAGAAFALAMPEGCCGASTAKYSTCLCTYVQNYCALFMYRVGQNHIYTVYTRYFSQGNHQIYGHIRCIYIRFWPTLFMYCITLLMPASALTGSCRRSASSATSFPCFSAL